MRLAGHSKEEVDAVGRAQAAEQGEANLEDPFPRLSHPHNHLSLPVRFTKTKGNMSVTPAGKALPRRRLCVPHLLAAFQLQVRLLKVSDMLCSHPRSQAAFGAPPLSLSTWPARAQRRVRGRQSALPRMCARAGERLALRCFSYLHSSDPAAVALPQCTTPPPPRNMDCTSKFFLS